MKPLILLHVTAVTVSFFLLTAFTTGRLSSPAPRLSLKDNTRYYYYFDDDDSFDAYNTVVDEATHLQSLTGHYVDTNPSGGTLLVNGYSNSLYPHTIWPSSFLYKH